jgi:predicted acetyltransferase
MNTELVEVDISQHNMLLNLIKFYCYEWSQYNGIDIDNNCEYEFEHYIKNYFSKEKHYPYFIMVDKKIAGFILIDDEFDYNTNSDYAISEFFVMYKYRRNGIGKIAATEIIKKLPGKWEIKMHPNNNISIKFWNDVVENITNGKYEYVESCEKAKYSDGELGTIICFEYKYQKT